MVLENAFGGALLAELLLGGPVTGLGSDVAPIQVGFQQSAESAVDDLMVAGEGPGGQRTLFIGVRRRPSIGASQKPFVKLMVDYLRVLDEHGDELETDSWRLGLAVEAPHTPTDEIKTLTYFARRQPDAGRFRAAVHAPRATTGLVRARLGNVDEVVAAAVKEAKKAGIDLTDEGSGDDLSWRLLRYLRVLDLRLEGDDAAGRTSLVARLIPLAGDAAAADDLRRRLYELSAGYAIGSAVVTQEMLRRDLSPVIRVAASPAYRSSWDVLESLEESLNSRTRRSLAARRPDPAAGVQFIVDRADIHASLVEAMGAAGRNAGQLAIHGEPGAGKSAAVLTAVEEIRRAGGAVIALSLRDLPADPGLAAAQFLQGPPRAVFAATAAAHVRLLVLDGAEAAQEAGPSLLHDLAQGASEAGLGLVAVTRDDARATVTDTLTGARAGVVGGGDAVPLPVAELEVPPLADDEIGRVRQTFVELDRLAVDERSAWLLRRLGIIDVLLRGDAVASLPDGSLSEADVFAAVWHAWVRNREQPSSGGATPDGRDQAMIGLARRYLTGTSSLGTALTADPRALASLRSDGLLLPTGPRFAFRKGDEFSSDMVRDFALAVLFTRDGFGVLRQAGGPRWALRAARMACQGALISPRPGSTVAGSMSELQREFDTMAAAFGDRCADLPWEAALTAGVADGVIRECAHELLQPGGAVLDRILRLITQRFSDVGVADPAISAPVVGFLIERAPEVETVRYRFAEEADKLIASWLRSVRRAEMKGATIEHWRPLRTQVRDYLLQSSGAGYQVEVECLALLGGDTDARVTSRLRDVAARQPHRLASCVELFDPTMSLAATDVDLLFDLTEAYYIKDHAATGIEWLNMGIRRHEHTGSIGVPFADWRFGPFWRLIPAAPSRALALINRMLDHAANCRVSADRQMSTRPSHAGDQAQDPRTQLGVQLDVPDIGSRHFAGDEQVWAWYRGTAIGPYPCMSALMAVERFADQWLQLGTPLPSLITELLRAAHNLAMAGLVLGLLTRHAEQVTAEADPFLSSPEVWGLESARTAMEAGIHAQGREDPSIQGSNRRNWTMVDLAGHLVFNAVNHRDQDRLRALRAAGGALVAAAVGSTGQSEGRDDEPSAGTPEANAGYSSGDSRFLAVARRWATMLDADNYTVTHDNGETIWEWQPPADIEDAMAERRSDLERANQAYRLINTYSLRPIPPHLSTPPALPPAETLTADSHTARSLAIQPLEKGPEPLDAATAVAAALLRTAAQQPASIAREDLEWAATTVAGALLHPLDAPGAVDGASYLLGANRSAASAAPCLLMPAFTQPSDVPALLDDEDLAALPEILGTATASPSTEVRMIVARSLAQVWGAPCGPGPSHSDRCRHSIAWAAVEAGARHVALGPMFPGGRRGHQQLDGSLTAALAGCPAGDLMLDLLDPPLITACDASRSSCCIAAVARDIRNSLMDAYTRTSVLWGEEGYDHRDDYQYAVAEALLAAAVAEPGLLTKLAADLADQSRALSETLRAMTVTATYSASARAALRSTWPAIMTAVLEAVDAGARGFSDHHWGGSALAEMIPSPSPTSWDTDLDATISAAREGWPTPPELVTQIERLLPYARGYWHVADNLIGLLKTMPVAEQARTGVPWVHQIITGRSKEPGMGTWLAVEWLRSLGEMSAVEDETRPLYNGLVDVLAAESYQGAVELQRQGESGLP